MGMDHQQLLHTTQEVLRRRILTKEAPNDLRNTYADVAFLDSYGRAPTLDDLQAGNSRALAFITEDDSGRKVRTIPGTHPPYNVYQRWLGTADVYVFVHIPKMSNVKILGWNTAEQVEQMPVRFFTDDEGEKTDYCHEAIPEGMLPMPKTFDFVSCEHGCGVWHHCYKAWECFRCGKLYYDVKNVRFMKKTGSDSEVCWCAYD